MKFYNIVKLNTVNIAFRHYKMTCLVLDQGTVGYFLKIRYTNPLSAREQDFVVLPVSIIKIPKG